MQVGILILNMFTIEMFREFTMDVGVSLNKGNRYYQVTRGLLLMALIYIVYKTMITLQYLLEDDSEDHEESAKDKRSTVMFLIVSLVIHITVYSEAMTTWEI